MNRWGRLVLLLIALVCFGVALSYPVRYYLEFHSNRTENQSLAQMRSRVLREEGVEDLVRRSEEEDDTDENEAPEETALPLWTPEQAPRESLSSTELSSAQDAAQFIPDEATPSPEPTASPAPRQRESDLDEDYRREIEDYLARFQETAEPTPSPVQTEQPGEEGTVWIATPVPTPTPTPSPTPTPTPDRRARKGALAYPDLPKVVLDEKRILPELQEIYKLNHHLIGWLTIADTTIDYPVMQSEDMKYYLTHDFYGNRNANGALILDTLCDAFTPSYNLVISGHHMKNGDMFGRLTRFIRKSYWEEHRFLEFDNLMERKRYVILAAFFSADYDEDQEGFRYNADIQFRSECEEWLSEIRKNQIYDTGVDARFGDEFITLTTCYKEIRKNGRFVLVARKIREGEDY